MKKKRKENKNINLAQGVCAQRPLKVKKRGRQNTHDESGGLRS
jgi:hypothetical protein